jgi:hypothetical protein
MGIKPLEALGRKEITAAVMDSWEVIFRLVAGAARVWLVELRLAEQWPAVAVTVSVIRSLGLP